MLFGFVFAALLSWQEKYEYCAHKNFDGQYCETAYELHERDLKFKGK